jgi:hypothetical protein
MVFILNFPLVFDGGRLGIHGIRQLAAKSSNPKPASRRSLLLSMPQAYQCKPTPLQTLNLGMGIELPREMHNGYSYLPGGMGESSHCVVVDALCLEPCYQDRGISTNVTVASSLMNTSIPRRFSAGGLQINLRLGVRRLGGLVAPDAH